MNFAATISKLQRYSKLIIKEEFKNEIQKELGRELRPYQLARAANSIRRVQIYVENILDNKFILDASHGINHVKHNLEYGYQLMNLIELPRRRQRTHQQYQAGSDVGNIVGLGMSNHDHCKVWTIII